MTLAEEVSRARVREALATRFSIELGPLGDARLPLDAIRLVPLGGGACQDNVRVEFTLDDTPRRAALRSDAPTALPGSLGRAAEAAVASAAASAGAPTPAPWGLARDLLRPGATSYFMDWVDGVALGPRVLRLPELEAARAALPDQLATALAAIHRVTPSSHPDLPIARAPFFPDADPALAALGFLRAMAEQLPSPRPAIALALAWLARHRPAPNTTTLIHGDFRVGNFMVGREGLRAVLDWEFAHWGDPAEDLAWLCVRDWRFGAVERAAGGLTSRAAWLTAYAAAGGAPIEPERLRWWEVAGNLRWGVATGLQGQRGGARGEDLALLAIPRRAPEMEYEALRLIERAERETER